jgi:hypothetical protein
VNRQSNPQPVDTFPIPRELWSRPDPESAADPAERPVVSIVTRLAPLVAGAFAYFAAFTATRGSNALGGVLLFCAFVALVTFGTSLVNYAGAWIAYRAAETQR